MRRWVPLLGLVLIGVGVVWWVADARGPLETGEQQSNAAGPATEENATGLQGRSKATPPKPLVDGRIEGTVLAGGVGAAARVELLRTAGPPAHVPPFAWQMDRSRAQMLLRPLRPDAEVVSTDDTSGDGAFSLPVHARGIYELRATSTDGRVGIVRVHVLNASGITHATVHIGGSEPSLHGTVRHADGRAFEGWVSVAPANMLWNKDAAWRTVFTELDAKGRYAFYGLPSGEVDVTAVQPGVMLYQADFTRIPHKGPFDLVVDGGKHSVYGTVIHDDTEEPMAGVFVEALRGPPFRSIAVVTDAEGGFRIAMPTKVSSVYARKHGFATAVYGALRKRYPLVLRMRPAGTVRGRIFDVATGDGVAGVPIRGLVWTGYPLRGNPWTVSSENGDYELTGLHGGDVQVVAWGNGWAPAKFEKGEGPGVYVTCVPGESVRVDIAVQRGGVLAGRVVDESGAGVPGTEVRIADEDTVNQYGNYVGDAVTDATGYFELDGIAPSDGVHANTKSPNHPSTTTGPYTIRSGERTEIEIELGPPRWCTVTLLDAATGSPIEGGHVRARTKRSDGEYQSHGTWRQTDARGEARLGPLDAGTPAVTYYAAGYLTKRSELGWGWIAVENAPEKGEFATTIRLDRGTPITGRIVAGAAKDVTKTTLWIRPSEAPGYETWTGHGRPESDGAFELTAPPTGRYTITAMLHDRGNSYSAAEDVEAGATDVMLDLKIQASNFGQDPNQQENVWRIRVLGPDGKPVRDARGVTVHEYAGGMSSSNIDTAGGEFEFTVYERAERVRLLVTGARTSTGEPAASGYFGPWDPEGGEDTVTLSAAESIEGRVVDQNGKGIQGVSVTAYGIAPDEWTKSLGSAAHGSMRTRPDGSFRIDGLGTGTYRIQAEPPAGHLGVEAIETKSGRRDIRIELRRGIDVVVTVLDPDGRPAVGANVHVRSNDEATSPSSDATADARGEALLRNLRKDGVYKLYVEFEESDEVQYSHETETWSPQAETVRFVRTYRIDGVVEDATGRSIPGISVAALDDAGNWRWARTTNAGRFVVDELAKGPVRMWTLRRYIDEERVLERTAKVMQAGAKDVVLAFDAGWVIEVVVANATPNSMLRIALTDPEGTRPKGDDPSQIWNGRQTFIEVKRDKRYQIYVGPTPDGRYAYHDGPIPDSGRLELKLEKGATIEGKVTNAAGRPAARNVVRLADRGVYVQSPIAPDGTYRLPGVPPGTWSVSCALVVNRTVVKKEAEVVAGGTANFDFRR